MRRWIIAGVAATCIAVLLFLVVAWTKPVVRAGENGIFANDCCGPIQFSDGKLLLTDTQTVRYTVAKDGKGPYLLPATYVGVVQDEGLEVDGTRSPIKLRLDRLPQPTIVVLYEGLRPYVFTRHAPPVRVPSGS